MKFDKLFLQQIDQNSLSFYHYYKFTIGNLGSIDIYSHLRKLERWKH